jgi:hypothetical protein
MYQYKSSLPLPPRADGIVFAPVQCQLDNPLRLAQPAGTPLLYGLRVAFVTLTVQQLADVKHDVH